MIRKAKEASRSPGRHTICCRSTGIARASITVSHEAVNSALPVVLDALGYQVEPFGQGGASTVTGRRGPL